MKYRIKLLFFCFLTLSFCAVCGEGVFAEDIGLRLGVYAETSEAMELIDKQSGSLFLTPQAEFERSFGSLYVYVDAEWTIRCVPEPPQSFYGEETVAWTFELGNGAVALGLHNENDIALAPRFDKAYGDNLLEPRLAYIRPFDSAGKLSLGVGIPFIYIAEKTAEKAVGVKVSAGYDFAFGFGLKLTGSFGVSPAFAYQETGLTVIYQQDQFYAEAAFKVNGAFDGWSITPEFDYYLNHLIPWASVEFRGDGKTVYLFPSIGIKYRF